MQELTNYVMEENDLMLEWMSKMEAETFKVEEGI
jgi:flagellar basal body-associated protein FliL